jgi:hypothetical protein
VQYGLANLERKTGIAAGYGMTHAVAFARVEKQHLISFGYRLVVAKMPHIDAPIWKYKLCRSRVLFFALPPMAAIAAHVADHDGWRCQQRLNGEFRHEYSLSRYFKTQS